MGTIYKRGKIYYVSVMADGKRLRLRVGSNSGEAKLVLKDFEVKIARKAFDFNPPDSRIDSLFGQFQGYSQTNHSRATVNRYRNVMANFMMFLSVKHPGFGNVSDLKPSVMEEYKTFRRTVDPRTIKLPAQSPYKIRSNNQIARTRTLNYEIKTLRSIFNYGAKNGLCDKNPCTNVPFLKVIDSKQPRFLSEEECRLFLGSCDAKLYPIFYTFLNTGLRLGELLNLQWADIDLKRQKLAIRRKEFWTPKAGEREVPLNDGMVELLRTIKPKKESAQAFVFTGEKGGQLKMKLRKALIRIAGMAGIENLTKIHSLRHTFASHLVMKGVDLPTVQKLLGHSDIQTTMIYAHLAQDHLVDAVNKLGFRD